MIKSTVAAVLLIGSALPFYWGGQQSFWDLWPALFLIFYGVGFLLIALEGFFFMEKPEIHKASQVAAGGLAVGILSALAALVLCQGGFTFSLPEVMNSLLAKESIGNWAIRLAGISGLYAFLYVVFGTAIWPLVKHYYLDPKYGLELKVPKGPALIALQLGRGILTALALLPSLALIPATSWTWWPRLAILLAVTMAIGPLMLAERWPARLRLIHAVEISLFSMAYAWAVWFFLARPLAN